MKVWWEGEGKSVSRKRVQRLMRGMGLRAIYRRPRTSQPGPGRRRYPYLLSNAEITRPNRVWAADVTDIPIARGFLYLVAVMDWYSRYVLAWRLSNTPRSWSGAGSGGGLLRRRPEPSAGAGRPGGLQHRSREPMHRPGVRPNASGPRGEDQLGRQGKVSRKHLCGAVVADGEARKELGGYFNFYNNRRPHQALGYWTLAEVFS